MITTIDDQSIDPNDNGKYPVRIHDIHLRLFLEDRNDRDGDPSTDDPQNWKWDHILRLGTNESASVIGYIRNEHIAYVDDDGNLIEENKSMFIDGTMPDEEVETNFDDAIKIVLDLATQNILTENQVWNDEDMKRERQRQLDAVGLVSSIVDL